MKNLKHRSFIMVLLTLVVAVTVVLAVDFFKVLPNHLEKPIETVDLVGNKVFATRISDFDELNALTFAMMTENEFIQSGLQPGVIDNEAFFSFEKRENKSLKGSYRFIILNIDPLSPNFDEESKKLAPYLKGDNSYHFTLQIPAVFSACAVYVSDVLTEVRGDISDYDFSDFSNNLGETTVHKSESEPLFIDLSFYSKSATIPPSKPIMGGKIVTVHFEGEQALNSGIFGMPLIGADNVVRGAAQREGLSLSLISVVALVIFAVFTCLCFLKRSVKYLPQQLVVLGIFGVFISLNALSLQTFYPYFWLNLKGVSFALIFLSAIMSLRAKIKGVKIWKLPAIFGSLVCVFAAVGLALSVPYELYGKLMKLFILIDAAMLLFLVLTYAFSKPTHLLEVITPTIAVVLGVVAAFATHQFFIFTSPHFWLASLMLGVSIFTSFSTFFNLEKRNRFLTTNLSNEVSRQTEVLKGIISERDNLLRHVSHDMKKTVRSVQLHLLALKKNKNSNLNADIIDAVDKKTEELLREFEELGNFAKLNFVAEKSSRFNVADILSKTYMSLSPDCIANGVVFKLDAANIEVYGKPKNLSSVLNNLIINALEHAECSEIILSATKKEEKCYISVSDNGKGISDDIDIFKPYASTANAEDNEGLGLYISKTLINSMGGDIDCIQEQGLLTFVITLPLS